MNVRYDVDLGEMSKTEDARLLSEFVNSKNKNMVLEYESDYTARRRRVCLRTWLTQKNIPNIYTHVRGNKIYFVKEN